MTRAKSPTHQCMPEPKAHQFTSLAFPSGSNQLPSRGSDQSRPLRSQTRLGPRGLQSNRVDAQECLFSRSPYQRTRHLGSFRNTPDTTRCPKVPGRNEVQQIRIQLLSRDTRSLPFISPRCLRWKASRHRFFKQFADQTNCQRLSG